MSAPVQEFWNPLSVSVSFGAELRIDPAGSLADLYEAGIMMGNALISPIAREKWGKICSEGKAYILLARGAFGEIMGIGVLRRDKTQSAALTLAHLGWPPKISPRLADAVRQAINIYVDCINAGVIPSSLGCEHPDDKQQNAAPEETAERRAAPSEPERELQRSNSPR